MTMFAPPDLSDLAANLDRDGYAIIPGLLDAATCGTVASMYDDPKTPFRCEFQRKAARYSDLIAATIPG
jgi:hypothetical protein